MEKKSVLEIIKDLSYKYDISETERVNLERTIREEKQNYYLDVKLKVERALWANIKIANQLHDSIREIDPSLEQIDQVDKNRLADRIDAFLEKYASISPNFKDETDDKYTGPDPYSLIACANNLRSGHTLYESNSDWGSGCYKPYTSEEGKKEHDYIVIKIHSFIYPSKK